jgi:hypothetical protein
MGIAAQNTVGSGLESRYIARQKLPPYRHGTVVDFELHAAGKP